MQFNTVSEEQRSSFLNKHFKDGFIDQVIFKAAEYFLKDYNRGRWVFCLAENGTAFMVPPQEVCVLMHPTTGAEIEVNNTLAGMILTHSVLLGKIQDGMGGLTKQHRDLKEILAGYCVELNRGDVLEALLH